MDTKNQNTPNTKDRKSPFKTYDALNLNNGNDDTLN